MDRVDAGDLPFFRGHTLSHEDSVLRQHILNLMTRFETSWDELETCVSHLENINESLKAFRKDGLLTFSQSHCRVTNEGRAFLRNICMAFDAHLARDTAKKQFSRTI